MKKIILIVFVLLPFIINANAISKENARLVARNFYYEKNISKTNIAYKSISFENDFVIKYNGKESYFVFNFSKNGFVIIASDDAVTPILAYSYVGSYTNENLPIAFQQWMENYSEQIAYVKKNKLLADNNIENLWNYYFQSDTIQYRAKEINAFVTPFLLSTWNQDYPYNEMCPQDAASGAGYGGRVPLGCTALSMAQIMFYYRYPNQGVGSHSYNSTTYGVQSANFGSTTYEYDKMLNDNIYDNDALARLNYHCGVSVEMDYAPDGSGAGLDAAAYALETNFKYSSSIMYRMKNTYSGNWESLLRTNLDAKRPFIYSGYSPEGGHAFVCDGYENDTHFHFNWGWGGSYDGYFYLTALNPGTSNFTQGQGAVVNIFPASSYPSYCTGNKTLTFPFGTFEDGSGNSNYNNNVSCSWLIAPIDTIKYLTLNFTKLTTESSNDIVTIYDGPTESSTLKGTYSGSTLPNSIQSTSNKMLVKFTSNGSSVAEGWQISYKSTNPILCSAIQNITSASGTISDGSGAGNYTNSTTCRFLIKPTGASQLHLTFTELNTELGKDTIRITDPISNTHIATISGSSIPATYISSSGQMLVVFKTNSNITKSGWSASYWAQVGIENNPSFDEISIFPNPAQNQLNFSFNVIKKQDLNIAVFDISGKKVYFEQFQNISGELKSNLDISSLNAGVYLFKITGEDGVTIRKFIKE